MKSDYLNQMNFNELFTSINYKFTIIYKTCSKKTG